MSAEKPLGIPTAQAVGRVYQDVLRELRPSGTNLIFSSVLVDPRWRVEHKLRSATPLGRLEELLAQCGLALQQVGPDAYAVVATRSYPKCGGPAVVPAATNPVPLSEIVVSASRYRLVDTNLMQGATLAGALLASQPGPGDDALRATRNVPGIAQDGVSAAPYIRGGAKDELLVLIDGFPIRQAFHSPGYQSLFSAIDPGIVAQMDVYTGAFPARYGNRMSGVFDIRTANIESPRQQELGLSFYNASARAAGRLPGTDSGGRAGPCSRQHAALPARCARARHQRTQLRRRLCALASSRGR